MISIPINVSDSRFLWYLDLFWFAHQEIYKDAANEKVYSVVIDDKNSDLNLSLKHKICSSWTGNSEIYNRLKEVSEILCVPINVQVALRSILDELDDSTVIELLDHDMVHFRPHPQMTIEHNQFFVCDLYENWHLYSLSKHKSVIDPFLNPFESSRFYNGGHVPIIGTVKTFKKILSDWIDIHIKIILNEPRTTKPSELICWWAGMYSFNAACEINKVQMIAKNYCYIPGANDLTDEMYICHYSIDKRFDKREYPNINSQNFLNNDFYSMIKKWNKF